MSMLRLKSAKRKEESLNASAKRVKLKIPANPESSEDKGGKSSEPEHAKPKDFRKGKAIYNRVRSSVALGESEGKNAAEQILEELVIGGEDRLIDTLNEQSVTHSKHVNEADRPKPVWEDEDETTAELVPRKERPQPGLLKVTERKLKGQQYRDKLKNQFEKVTGSHTPSWARLRWEKAETEKDDSDEDEELLKSTGDYLAASERLPRTNILLQKCKDANSEEPAKGWLRAVEFHPTAQVMLAGGRDKTMNLFQIDGKTNPKIQSIMLENFPIHTAHFTRDGHEVIMGSGVKWFYYYDMIAGKVVKVPRIKGLEGECSMKKFVMSPDGSWITFLGAAGYIHIVSAKSKEWLWSVKMNGNVQSVAFSPDATQMYSHGDDGEVYIWDLRKRDCIHKFIDEGCTNGLSVACSPNGQFLATGSYSGVVNIYDTSSLTSSLNPKPLKAVMNMTSPCTNLAFNPHTEILALASCHMRNAVKLVHFPSLTVFANYPYQQELINTPLCLDFSVNGGYFVIGNDKGRAKLYRVQHYGNY